MFSAQKARKCWKITTPRTSKSQTTLSYKPTTFSKTTNKQSTRYATTDFNRLSSTGSNTGVTSQSPTIATTTTTTVTTAIITETSTNTSQQSSTTAISSCLLYDFLESNGTLPAAGSVIHPDTCSNISIDICSSGPGNVLRFCECDNEGVWTIIQRRLDGCVDFYRNWTEYREGFGNINGEYWLGNDVIHQITSNGEYTLKVVLQDWDGVTKYAMYDAFRIAGEADSYRLTLGSYTGDAGNSLNYNNGQQFSTWDRDNDGYTDVSCAQVERGAWWHNHCTTANLNGPYLDANTEGVPRTPKGIFWYHWHGWYYSLKETKMMIKSNAQPTSTDKPWTSDPVTSKLSTTQSSSDTTMNPIQQTTTTGDTTTSRCHQYTTAESDAALPAAASGIHPDICANISTDICSNGSGNVHTFCECDNEGVWTIIQRRIDGCVDFYRNWTEYKEGFGNINGEFWLGNAVIHQITSNADYTLKVVLQDWDGVTKYAKYNAFRIADEADNYRLTVGSYSGAAGNSMNYNNGEQFSTWDVDNDGYSDVSCAQVERSGWWHNHCTIANLNGLYLDANAGGRPRTPKRIFWYHWHGWYYSFKETKMMIKLA